MTNTNPGDNAGGVDMYLDAQDDGAIQGPLVQCPGCGRNFAQERLEKHSRVCKSVFQQKRKQFNSAAARLGEFDNAGELISNAKKIENNLKEREAKSAANVGKVKEDDKAMPKWKKESLEFRAALLAQKAAQGDSGAAAKAAALKEELGSASVADDKTTCPHCGRSFNKDSAERHIAICLKMFAGRPGGGRLVRGGGKTAAAGAQPGASAARRLSGTPRQGRPKYA